MPESPNQPYLPELDHLRGLAAMLIVCYHGLQLISAPLEYDRPWRMSDWPATTNPLFAFLAEGHTAVALFFVVSGFILMRGAAPRLAQGRRLRYGAFLRNRALRIYPLYIFLLLLGAYTHLDHFSLTGLLQTLLPLINLPGALELDWFTAMFWTVATLGQFYLLFPFLTGMYARDGTRPLWLLLAVFIVGRFACVAMGAGARDLAYLSLVGRMDQLLLGVFAAILYESLDEKARRRLGWTLPFAVGGLVAAVYGFHLHGGWPAEGWWKLWWVTAEGALWTWALLAYLPAASRWRGSSLSQGVAWLGRVSYAVFLTHIVIIQMGNLQGWYVGFTGSSYTDAMLNTALVALPLILVAAALLHHAVEKPFLAMRANYWSEPPEG